MKNPFIGFLAFPITIIATAFMKDNGLAQLYVLISVFFGMFWFIISLFGNSLFQNKTEKENV